MANADYDIEGNSNGDTIVNFVDFAVLSAAR
jgi:hypothetical protein